MPTHRVSSSKKKYLMLRDFFLFGNLQYSCRKGGFLTLYLKRATGPFLILTGKEEPRDYSVPDKVQAETWSLAVYERKTLSLQPSTGSSSL